jgi:hypothetical protein
MHRLLQSAASTCLLITLLAAAGCPGGPKDMPATQPQAQMQPLTIEQRFSGEDPGLQEAGVYLFNSREQMEAAGARDMLNRQVDFDAHSLIVLGMGEQSTGGYWAHIEGAQVIDGKLYVQGKANQPGPAEAVTQVVTHPYAAAVVPKIPDMPVVSEVRSVEGQSMPNL